jgi:hypothetical protein
VSGINRVIEMERSEIRRLLSSLFSELSSDRDSAKCSIDGRTVVVYRDYDGCGFGIRLYRPGEGYASVSEVFGCSGYGLPGGWFGTVREAIVDCISNWSAFDKSVWVCEVESGGMEDSVTDGIMGSSFADMVEELSCCCSTRSSQERDYVRSGVPLRYGYIES